MAEVPSGRFHVDACLDHGYGSRVLRIMLKPTSA
jgi:hypothetical protein